MQKSYGLTGHEFFGAIGNSIKFIRRKRFMKRPNVNFRGQQYIFMSQRKKIRAQGKKTCRPYLGI